MDKLLVNGVFQLRNEAFTTKTLFVAISGECFRCVYALFTYVSLDDKKAVQKVPQLVVRTEDEKQRFKEGQSRYEIKKEERLKALAAKRPKQEK